MTGRITTATAHSRSGRGADVIPADLDGLLDWLAEVISEQRLKEVQSSLSSEVDICDRSNYFSCEVGSDE